MATYYKYAERDASSQVNWAEITSNMVNSLKEVEAIRESKRQAIDDATTELSRTLSEAPQGEHSGLNEFAMTYANNAQQMRLMQDQLLKSGQLKLKDYNIGRANLTEGTTQLFNLGKKYQAVYKEKMDRFKNGESGLQEQFQMAELEAFANFSNHEAYINPTNGQVSVGKLINEDRNGKTVRTMDKTPGSFITVQELNFSVSQKVDKYKLDGLDADVDRLAKRYVKTFGTNFSIDDVRELPEFKQMKKDMINAQMATGEQNIGSMLADYVKIAPNGKTYGYTRDPNKQDENTILLVADPGQPGSGRLVPDFSSEIGKKQYKEAEDFIGREIEKQLSRTETKTEPRPPKDKSPAQILEEKQENVVDLWNSLYSETDPDRRKSIVSSIISSPYNKQARNTLIGIDFVSKNVGTETNPVTQDFMEVRYVDPAGNRTGDNAIPITDSYVDWAAAGVEIHGIQDKAKREKGLSKESIFGGKTKPFEGTSAGRGDEIQSNATKVRNQIRAMLGNKENVFKNMTDNDVAIFLQSKLGALGFSFRPDNTPFNDVLVKYPGGGDDEYVLEVGSYGSAEKTRNFLDFILPLISNEAADVFIESGVDISGGVIGGSKVTESAETETKTGGKARD